MSVSVGVGMDVGVQMVMDMGIVMVMGMVIDEYRNIYVLGAITKYFRLCDGDEVVGRWRVMLLYCTGHN